MNTNASAIILETVDQVDNFCKSQGISRQDILNSVDISRNFQNNIYYSCDDCGYILEVVGFMGKSPEDVPICCPKCRSINFNEAESHKYINGRN